MKRILKTSLLVMLAAPMLIGCGGNQNNSEALEKSANQAAMIVGSAYNGYASSNGISLAGGKLIADYTNGDYKFSFTYSVAPVSGTYDIEYVKVEDGRLKVEIPTFAELNEGTSKSVSYAAYKLSASIKYAEYKGEGDNPYADKINQEVTTHSWNIRVNAEDVKPVWQKISQARLKQTNETVVTTGYIAGFMNNADSGEFSNGVWIADGSEGMMLYGGCLTSLMGALHIGDMVLVIGPASPYNGLFEVKPKSVTVVDYAEEEIAEPNYKVLNENGWKALVGADASDLVQLNNVTIKTDLTKLKPAEGACTITVTIGSTDVTCYVNKHCNKDQRIALVDYLKANSGKACTVKGILGYNSDTVQITIAQLTEEGDLTDCILFAE